MRWSCAAVVLIVSTGSAVAQDQRKQRRTLGAADQPRFTITDRIWPDKLDQPHVCLWKDDKLAAVSITIDDNTRPDHEWWMAQGEKYGYRFTWFVITGLVEKNPGYHGVWGDFAKLRAAGHEVQSHTVTHLSPARGFEPDRADKGVAHEYAQSINDIEAHVKDAQVTTLAYPGGKNSDHNSPEEAAKHYIAARGTRGHINAVNQVNYLETASVGNGPLLDGKGKWALIGNVLDPAAYRPNLYRGWYVTHYHQVTDDAEAQVIERLDFLKEHETDFWIAGFREAAMYGQERDTARLTDIESTATTLQFTLTDDMHDELFDYPLTIKLRLPADWADAQATQADKPIAARVVEHEDAKFALVQAVPDRGTIVVSSK